MTDLEFLQQLKPLADALLRWQEFKDQAGEEGKEGSSTQTSKLLHTATREGLKLYTEAEQAKRALIQLVIQYRRIKK